MNWKTNKTQTIPKWGGGYLKFKKCDLIAVDKYEGVPAITVSTHEEPIKMRISIDEFWDDFYASRQL